MDGTRTEIHQTLDESNFYSIDADAILSDFNTAELAGSDAFRFDGSPAAPGEDAGKEGESNVPPAGALIIKYKRLKDVGTKHSTWESRIKKFFNPEAKSQPMTLTPGMELNNRGSFMFAANRPLTKKEVKCYSLSGKGKNSPQLLHYATFEDETFFALSFPQGDWEVELEWEEPDVESTKVIAKKPRDTSDTQPPKVVSIPIDILNKKDEQYVPQCTSVLVLIPKSDEHLRKSIEDSLVHTQGYARIQSSNLFHKLCKPLKHYIVNTFLYDKVGQEELGEVLKYTDNIVFFGHSSSSSYLLHTLTDKNQHETKLRTPYLDPTEWPEDNKSYRDISYEPAMVLSKLQELNKLSQCCALMMAQGIDGSVLPHSLSAAISSATEAPITPKLYICWKFSGLEGKSESEYLRDVTQFLQQNGIPVIIDGIYNGCVAIIMHGPTWAWHYLMAFSPLIASTFGSDLRSITQIGINNIVDLMRHKDNTQFTPLLTKLCLQMAHDKVPCIIKKKLSIIFMPVTKLTVAKEDEYDIEELNEQDNALSKANMDIELNDGMEDMQVEKNESIDSTNDNFHLAKLNKNTHFTRDVAWLITKQQFQEGIANLCDSVKASAFKLKWLHLVDWNLAEYSWSLFEKLRGHRCCAKEVIILCIKNYVNDTIGFQLPTKEFVLHLLLISLTKEQSNRGRRKHADTNGQHNIIQRRNSNRFFFDAVEEDMRLIRVLWNLRRYFKVEIDGSKPEGLTTIHHSSFSNVSNWSDGDQVSKYLKSLRPLNSGERIKKSPVGRKPQNAKQAIRKNTSNHKFQSSVSELCMSHLGLEESYVQDLTAGNPIYTSDPMDTMAIESYENQEGSNYSNLNSQIEPPADFLSWCWYSTVAYPSFSSDSLYFSSWTAEEGQSNDQ